jgi:excisionase family DNA binding protein
MGIASSDSSAETAHPEDPPGAKTTYSAAVAEVLSRGTLGPDSLAELHAIDQQFAESVQAKSVPTGVGTPLREAERPVARKNPLGRATRFTPEHANGADDDREFEPFERTETAAGSTTTAGDTRASREPESAVEAAIRMSVERLYSPKEAAEYLRVHVTTIRRWVRLGRLPASRLAGGPYFRIRESDLLRLLDPFEPGAERSRRSV